VSLISGKLNACFSWKVAFASTLSKLHPRIWTLAASKSAFWSRNPRPSTVHPGVLAIG